MSHAHRLLLDLCARLRLACEAASALAGAPIEPRDVQLEDLAPEVAARLRQAAIADLGQLINQSGDHPWPSIAVTRRRGAA